MMTNVMAPIEMTSAAPAVDRGDVAYWYSFNSANGEPEGSEEAASYEEAAVQWGEHLTPGDMRLLEVWGPQGNRWFKVEREMHGAVASECST